MDGVPGRTSRDYQGMAASELKPHGNNQFDRPEHKERNNSLKSQDSPYTKVFAQPQPVNTDVSDFITPPKSPFGG